MELRCTHAGSCNANQGARVELIFHHPIRITGPVMRPRSYPSSRNQESKRNHSQLEINQ